MAIHHHPHSELLLAYAAGTLDEAASVLVASHLTLCPHCRATMGTMEAVGGAVLEALPATTLDKSWASIAEKLETIPPLAAPTPTQAPTATVIPYPLRRYVGDGALDTFRWQRGMGADYVSLETKGPGQARLVRVPPGECISHHGHSGDELVLVLAGGYRDETGTYWRGDVASADASLIHRPMAEPGETCICVTLNYGVLLPSILAPLGRLFRRSA